MLPCMILIPGLFFIPEYPRWLAKMGMTEDFEASLQVLRGFDTDISLEVDEIKRSVASSSTRRGTIRLAELKRRRYWFPLTVGIGLLSLQQLTGINCVLFYATTIFESAGVSSSSVATFGLGATQVIATVFSTWLMDKAGRRLLLIVSSAGVTLSVLIVSVAFFLKDMVSSDSSFYGILSILSVVGVVLLMITFNLGLGPIPWIIMSDLGVSCSLDNATIKTELATKQALFAGDSELQQLLHIFRLLGTPNEQIWPGVSSLKDWHEYPQWKPQNLSSAVPNLDNNGLDILAPRLIDFSSSGKMMMFSIC